MTALRPRLEHAQIITRADMARLAKLGGMYLILDAYADQTLIEGIT